MVHSVLHPVLRLRSSATRSTSPSSVLSPPRLSLYDYRIPFNPPFSPSPPSFLPLSPTMRFSSLALLSLSPLLALAQDGSVTGPTSSQNAAGYSCDASKCKLPDCNCASTSPPGGISPVSLLLLFSHFISRRRGTYCGLPMSGWLRGHALSAYFCRGM